MRYQDFIRDVRELIEQAESLSSQRITHNDANFRSWRHRVESLVDEAFALGYRLPGPFRSAARHHGVFDKSEASKQESLHRELADSLIELRHYVSQFEKYGVPVQRAEKSSHPAEASVPDKVTIAWLYRHVPVSLWLAFVGLLVSSFLIGVAVSRTEPYKAVESWVKSILSNS